MFGCAGSCILGKDGVVTNSSSIWEYQLFLFVGIFKLSQKQKLAYSHVQNPNVIQESVTHKSKWSFNSFIQI